MLNPSPKLSVLTMGHTGVIIDADPVEPEAPKDGLLKAQNANHDPKSAHLGAIRKRPGLAQFNTQYAGGVILGGIPMPVAGFGGAPASGGGAILGTGDADTGTSIGTGNMTGAPGATFDGGVIATTPVGAPLFNGGAAPGTSNVFGGGRLIVIGYVDGVGNNSTIGGTGWYVTSKEIANTATSTLTPGPPVAVYSYPPIAPFTLAFGTASCIDTITNQGLFYPGAHGIQTMAAGDWARSLNPPTVRKTNGAVDALFVNIPRNLSTTAGISAPGFGITFIPVSTPGFPYTIGQVITPTGGTFTSAATYTFGTGMTDVGVYTVAPANGSPCTGGVIGSVQSPVSTPQRTAVVGMHAATDGFLYLCVKDKYNGQTTAGSVGRVFRLRPTTGELVEWNFGYVNGPPTVLDHVPYCSSYFDGYLYVGYFPNAIEDVVNLDKSNGSYAVNELAVNMFGACLAQYNGRLWYGTGVWSATPTFATLWSRRPGEIGADGVSCWTTPLTSSGGVVASGNYFSSMVEFQGALYAAWYGNNTFGKIYKIVADNIGVPTSTSFTITTAFSAAVGPWQLYVDGDVMYAIGIGNTQFAYTTKDGATWTSRGANLPTFGSTARPNPIFGAFNQ